MITKKFTSKPYLLEGVQWFVTKTPSDDAKPIVDWVNQNGGSAKFVYDFFLDELTHKPRIFIGSSENTFHALPGDWICRDHYGAFHVFNPVVFQDFTIPITDESYSDTLTIKDPE